jgi:hypothetical protein
LQTLGTIFCLLKIFELLPHILGFFFMWIVIVVELLFKLWLATRLNHFLLLLMFSTHQVYVVPPSPLACLTLKLLVLVLLLILPSCFVHSTLKLLIDCSFCSFFFETFGLNPLTCSFWYFCSFNLEVHCLGLLTHSTLKF